MDIRTIFTALLSHSTLSPVLCGVVETEAGPAAGEDAAADDRLEFLPPSVASSLSSSTSSAEAVVSDLEDALPELGDLAAATGVLRPAAAAAAAAEGEGATSCVQYFEM